MIWSKRKYRYGLFELRFKVPEGQGIWPAFWLFGQNNKDEIDFFEMKGEKNNQVHVDIHCPDNCDRYYYHWYKKVNWGGWVKLNEYLQDGYNTITVIWEKGQINWYINGTPISRFYGELQTVMNIILNNSIARDNGPFSPGPNADTKFPADFSVDYVRVYGHPDTTAAVTHYLDYLPDTSFIRNITSAKGKGYLFKGIKKARTQGFISFYPTGFGNYVIQMNGKFRGWQCSIKNAEDHLVYTQALIYHFNRMELAKLRRGKYTLEITGPGAKNIVHEFTVN
jgi:hypothetical protein